MRSFRLSVRKMEIIKVFALFGLVKSAAVTFEGSGQENEGRVSATGC